jgi:hypothetical protein
MQRLTIRDSKTTPAPRLTRRARWFRAVLWVVFIAVLASGFSTTVVSASQAYTAPPSVSKQSLEKSLAGINGNLNLKEASLDSAVGAARPRTVGIISGHDQCIIPPCNGPSGTVPPRTATAKSTPTTIDTDSAESSDPVYIVQDEYGTATQDPSQTLFGRFYAINPADMGKVKTDATSPPMACPGADSTYDINKDACFTKYSSSPEQLLPAWRWRDDVALYSNVPGVEGIFLALFSFLASIMFTLSQLAWWMLLEISQWALTDNLVERAGRAMNRGYMLFVDVLNASGLFFLLAAFGLLILARLFLRGRVIRAFSLVLAFIIPIAVMQGLAYRAQQGGSTSNPSWGASPLPTASPAWFAVRGVNIVDGFSTWLSSGFGQLSTVSGSLQIQEASLVDPSCASYVAALYDQYYAYSSSPVRNIKNNATKAYQAAYQNLNEKYTGPGGGSASGWATASPYFAGVLELNAVQANRPTEFENWSAMLANRSAADKLADARFYKVATLSQLWLRGFLGSWQSAQFGNEAAGARMYCHLLESNADIHPLEQLAIASIATRYSKVRLPTGNVVESPGYEGISENVFESGMTQLDTEQRILAWAACSRVLDSDGNWQWKAGPGWDSLGNNKRVSNKDCEAYFTQSPSTVKKVENWFRNNTSTATKFFSDYGCGFRSATNRQTTATFKGINCLLHWADSGIGNIPFVGKYIPTPGNKVEEFAEDVRPQIFAPLKFKDKEDVDRAVAASITEAQDSSSDPQANPQAMYGAAKAAGKTVLALKGHNGSQRLTLSILALITSILYVYAIGFLALGTFFAKIGLVILIIMLPGTLLLLALPTAGDGHGSARAMGQKMLRMTFGFILSHGVLSLVLGMLLSVMLLLEALVGGTGQGVTGGFVHGLIPITALFVVRAVLKAVGLGDIASAQGALGMPLSAALRVAGKDMQMRGMDAFSSATSKAGLNKFDAAAKRVGRRAALAVPKATGRLAKYWGRRAGRKISDFVGLPEAKEALFGKRDPITGALTKHGLMHRFTTFTGLVGLASSARRLAPDALARIGTSTPAGRALHRLGSLGTEFSKRFPLPGKAWNAFLARPSVAKIVQGSARQKAEARQARKAWQAVAFKSKGKRLAALAAIYGEEQSNKVLERDLADRYAEGTVDAAGNPVTPGTIIRTPDGKPVYAYKAAIKVRDASGRVLQLGDVSSDATDTRDLYALEAYDAAGQLVRIRAQDLSVYKDLSAQVDASGNPVLDAAGNPVYGYRYDDGKSVSVVSHAGYLKLRAGDSHTPPVPESAFSKLTETEATKSSYKEGVRYVYDRNEGSSLLRHADVLKISDPAERAAAWTAPITEFDEFRQYFTEEEIWSSAEAFREQFGLRKGQFVVSPFGLPVLRPSLEKANGKGRFVIGKYLEETREMAARERTQYLPNHQKMILPGESLEGYSMRLKMMEDYLGGFDSNGDKVDIVYELTGHRSDSPRGQHELQLALDGKECVLNSWRPEIPPDVFNAMVMTASARSHRTEDSEIKDAYSALAAERNQMMAEMKITVVKSDEALDSLLPELDMHLTKVLGEISDKLKNTRELLRPLEEKHRDILGQIAALQDRLVAFQAEYESSPHYSAATKSWDTSSDPSLVLEERKLLNEINKITSDLAADRSALASAAANLTKLKADEAKIIDDLTQSTKRSRELMSEIRERSQAVESAGKGLYFGHRALLRDAGSVDWSAIDSEIHDFCEDFVSRWDTTSQNMESVCSAFEAAVLAGENTRASLAYKELDALLEETQKASKRAHQLGSDFHNRIVRETALREGDAHSYGVSSKASSIRSLLSAGRG